MMMVKVKLKISIPASESRFSTWPSIISVFKVQKHPTKLETQIRSFPDKMGLPLVFIHFQLEFSMK